MREIDKFGGECNNNPSRGQKVARPRESVSPNPLFAMRQGVEGSDYTGTGNGGRPRDSRRAAPKQASDNKVGSAVCFETNRARRTS